MEIPSAVSYSPHAVSASRRSLVWIIALACAEFDHQGDALAKLQLEQLFFVSLKDRCTNLCKFVAAEPNTCEPVQELLHMNVVHDPIGLGQSSMCMWMVPEVSAERSAGKTLLQSAPKEHKSNLHAEATDLLVADGLLMASEPCSWKRSIKEAWQCRAALQQVPQSSATIRLAAV